MPLIVWALLVLLCVLGWFSFWETCTERDLQEKKRWAAEREVVDLKGRLAGLGVTKDFLERHKKNLTAERDALLTQLATCQEELAQTHQAGEWYRENMNQMRVKILRAVEVLKGD